MPGMRGLVPRYQRLRLGAASTGTSLSPTPRSPTPTTATIEGVQVDLKLSDSTWLEVWVDGELTRAVGQRGGSVVAGWNASNRLVIGRDVKPGQKIQLAVFGANGPHSSGGQISRRTGVGL